MKIEDIKVGEVYKASNNVCPAYDHREADSIKVNRIDAGFFLSYDILKNGEKVDSCCACLHPEHLEPLDKPKFKVGDMVRVKNVKVDTRSSEDILFNRYMPKHCNTESEIIAIQDGKYIKLGSGEGRSFSAEWLELIQEEPEEKRFVPEFSMDEAIRTINESYYEIYKEINKPKKTIMSYVKDKIKNFKLSEEDRILRSEGLEDEHGEPTSEAREMMMEELILTHWDNRRKEVAADLLAMKKEDK